MVFLVAQVGRSIRVNTGASPFIHRCNDQQIPFGGNANLATIYQGVCIAFGIGCCFVEGGGGFRNFDMAN